MTPGSLCILHSLGVNSNYKIMIYAGTEKLRIGTFHVYLLRNGALYKTAYIIHRSHQAEIIEL